MSSRLGGKKLPSIPKQMEKIQVLQARVKELLDAGYELLQADEAVFCVDGSVQRHWAQIGQPICKGTRWSDHEPVVVFCVLSASRGVVHWHLGYNSFTAEDIREALREVRGKLGDGVKLAIGLDNA